MKCLSALACILLLLPTLAEGAAAIPLKGTPSNIQIINGKRFYSLQNVRRFNGGLNNPGALAVLHHPHDQASIPARRSFTSNAGPATPAATGSGKAGSDQVLSIFAPDDKNIPPVPAR